MALGFTVPAITSTKVVPDKTLTRSSNPRVRVQSFGDGYEQRIVDGINNINEIYSVSFVNRAKAEAEQSAADQSKSKSKGKAEQSKAKHSKTTTK